MRNILRSLATALGMICATHAAAVHVSAEGSGQVLIYPYYTVQQSEGNEFNTYISIVSEATVQSKALRVRFREGRNGREVAGFNLLLKPRDAWTGAVIATPTGARLLSADISCMSPQLASDLQPLPPYVDFSTAGYTGANADAYGAETQRTREGYVEVFEMAAFDIAPSCAEFQAASFAASSLRVPSGQLSGTLTLINVQSGLDFTVNAVALADAAVSHYFRPASNPYPDYNVVEMNTTGAFYFNGKFFRAGWATGLEAINFALLAQRIENEIVLDRNTRSGTDFVITLPTKRLGGAGAPFFLPANGDIPFSTAFNSRYGELHSLYPVGECPFMCPPANGEADLRLRHASSVLSFRTVPGAPSAGAATSDVLGSSNGWLVNLPTLAQNGYVSITVDQGSTDTQFPFVHSRIELQTGIATPSGTARYAGLPAVGFMARTFRNGTLACAGAALCQGNYGGAFPHRLLRYAIPD